MKCVKNVSFGDWLPFWSQPLVGIRGTAIYDTVFFKPPAWYLQSAIPSLMNFSFYYSWKQKSSDLIIAPQVNLFVKHKSKLILIFDA